MTPSLELRGFLVLINPSQWPSMVKFWGKFDEATRILEFVKTARATLPRIPSSQPSSQTFTLQVYVALKSTSSFDKLFVYKAFDIFIDDKTVGLISKEGNSTLEIQPGHHTIFVRAAGPAFRREARLAELSTPPLTFNIAPGEKVSFLCREAQSSVRPARIQLFKWP